MLVIVVVCLFVMLLYGLKLLLDCGVWFVLIYMVLVVGVGVMLV